MKVKVRKARDEEGNTEQLRTEMGTAKGRTDHGVVGAGAAAARGPTTPSEDRVVVMVAMKMDEPSRELLTWALVKVARPGDRVLAIHVLPNPTTSSSASTSTSTSSTGDNPSSSLSLLKLVKGFDSVLAVYEGFCNLKQIDLKIKLCRAASVRKALVQEAAQLQASHLILGVNADTHGFRSSSTSVARYCAKKLPPRCSITALDSGKVVFQRPDPRSRNTRHRPVDSEPIQVANEDTDIRPFHCFLSGTNLAQYRHHTCFDANYIKSPLSNAATDRTSSWSCPPTSANSDAGSQTTGSPHSYDDVNPVAVVPAPDTQAAAAATTTTPRSLSVLIRELPEPRPGWPLLRRAVMQSNKKANAAAASASTTSSKMSVVQWVMQLPDRFPESPRHPDHSNPDGTETTDARECSTSTDSDEDGTVFQPESAVHSDRFEAILAGNDQQPKIPKQLLESLRTRYGPVCRMFTYQELADATSNFSTENLIGRGGSSHVYRGCLPGGREMAVKIMKPTEEARKEFALEIEMITALHHPNIITLLGFCVDDNCLLLVYDFLARGSLEDNLHGDKHAKSDLGWSQRYKVALGVADALQHLHSGGSTRPLIHRDVKSSNILLSHDYQPTLSDFGLATWVSSASSHITCTDVAGTFGYLAPEYFMFGKVNEKIDVYAFGVVLLELLSGKKPIGDEYPKGQESLVMWAKPILQSEQLSQLMDATLDGQYDEDQAEAMVLAASLCLSRSPQLRPKMDLVLKLLRGDPNLVKWARLQMKGTKDPGQELDDDEADIKCFASDFRSHLNLALLDVEDDALSVTSTEHSVGDILAHGSLEAYLLQGRWSRSSSFD